MPVTESVTEPIADPGDTQLEVLVADALAETFADAPCPADSADGADSAGAVDGDEGRTDLPDGWRGVLAPLGVRSGDGRLIAMPSVLRVRQAPVPMRWRERDTMGHDDAVVVSRIDRAWIADGQLWGEGPFDLDAPHYQEAARQLAAGFCNAISVGLDDETVEFDEANEVIVFSDWRLAEATMVQVGAFDEARIEPVYGYAPTAAARAGEPVMSVTVSAAGVTAVTAGVSGATGLPLGDRDEKWDGGAARRELLAWATSGSGDDAKVNASKLGQGFLWRDPDGDPATLAAYKLPFARPAGDGGSGGLRAVWSGVTAAAAALEGSRGGVSIPSGDVSGVRSRVAGYYRAAAKKYDDDTIKPPWTGDSAASAASLVAAAGSGVLERLRFDRDDFTPPELDGPTALKVTPDGRVHGHLAIWGECHLGVGDKCIIAPKSRTNYAFFHVGEVALTNGEDLPVGKITLGAGHADPRLGLVPALEHYDNTAAVVAVVRASEDTHGIVVAGRVLPDTSPERVTELQMSPLSGDWRRAGAHLELVAALAVNTPGFPVPRTIAASVGGRQVSLVAAGVVPPVADALSPLDIDRQVGAALARRQRAAQLAARVGLDPRSRAAALAARLNPEGGQ